MIHGSNFYICINCQLFFLGVSFSFSLASVPIIIFQIAITSYYILLILISGRICLNLCSSSIQIDFCISRPLFFQCLLSLIPVPASACHQPCVGSKTGSPPPSWIPSRATLSWEPRASGPLLFQDPQEHPEEGSPMLWIRTRGSERVGELEWWDFNPHFSSPCPWLLSLHYTNTQCSRKTDSLHPKAQILATTTVHPDGQGKGQHGQNCLKWAKAEDQQAFQGKSSSTVGSLWSEQSRVGR